MRRNFGVSARVEGTELSKKELCIFERHGPGCRPVRKGNVAVDEQQKIEHQIELATRTAALVKDETTVHRLRSFAEEMSRKLLRMMRRGKVRARAYELWEQAGRPADRDLDFWLEAERQIEDEHDERRRPDGSQR